jgi:F-type H+-transporting ATPase subunit epsilon
MPRRPFQCDIYTPSRHVTSSKALHVQFPASDGKVGVLGGRSPMVALLGVGTLELTDPQDRQQEYFLSRGFARMSNDMLVFLAEEASELSEINAEQAWEQLQQAQALPARTAQEQEIRKSMIESARARFNAAQRYRRKKGLVSRPAYDE